MGQQLIVGTSFSSLNVYIINPLLSDFMSGFMDLFLWTFSAFFYMGIFNILDTTQFPLLPMNLRNISPGLDSNYTTLTTSGLY